MGLFPVGTYGYDKAFFDAAGIDFLELACNDNLSRVLVVPDYQGRVMTSTSGGENGRSYGWINHSLIESGETDPRFNAYGGEERFWLGPEDGPYSIFFEQGDEQEFQNWNVPAVIDTESWDIEYSDQNSAKFIKESRLTNASGNVFHFNIERTVSLLSKYDVSEVLGIDIPDDLQIVAYESDNVITNLGPFYELETSSPALALQPNESEGHVQRVMHFEGEEDDLALIVKALFDLEIGDIVNKF